MSARERNSRCHKCNNFGHQKRNCPTNKLNKPLIPSSTLIKDYLSLNTSSYVKNIKEVKKFLLRCEHKNICFQFILNQCFENKTSKFLLGTNTIARMTGVFKSIKDKNIFFIDSINCIAWGRHCRETYPEIALFHQLKLKKMLKLINSKKTLIDISCNIYEKSWTDILSELQTANKISYTYVAEDKRSGCNLVQYLEIDGKKVDHSAHADCVRPLEKGQFYDTICDLYDKYRTPSYAKESILYFIGMRKEIPIIGKFKDVIILIAKELWKSRNDASWGRKNVPSLMNNPQTISVIY